MGMETWVALYEPGLLNERTGTVRDYAILYVGRASGHVYRDDTDRYSPPYSFDRDVLAALKERHIFRWELLIDTVKIVTLGRAIYNYPHLRGELSEYAPAACAAAEREDLRVKIHKRIEGGSHSWVLPMTRRSQKLLTLIGHEEDKYAIRKAIKKAEREASWRGEAP